jgi:hypothetical protein
VVAIGKVRITTSCWIKAQKSAVLIYFVAEASNNARVLCVEYKQNGTQNIKLGWGKFSNYTIAPDGDLCVFSLFLVQKFFSKAVKGLSYFLPALYA